MRSEERRVGKDCISASSTTLGIKSFLLRRTFLANGCVLVPRLTLMSLFIQTEDSIRVKLVTGVQTCALPICFADGKMIFLSGSPELERVGGIPTGRLSGIVNHHIPGYLRTNQLPSYEIGRASCRERLYICQLNNTWNKKLLTETNLSRQWMRARTEANPNEFIYSNRR